MLDPVLLRKDLAGVAARLRTRGFELDVAALEASEATRKSVRPDVQLLIREHAVRGDHRVGRRRLRGDSLEQLCDGLAAGERRSAVERRRFRPA